MKKILIFLLTALFVVSAVMLVACDAKVTDIKIKGAPAEVIRGESINYDDISVVVTYDDNTTKTFKLTDSGVQYNRINTDKTGTQTLTVTVGGKSAQVSINVVEGDVGDDVVVTEYSNAGSGYEAYLNAVKEQSNKETEFVLRDVNYKVGVDNGYVFVPHVTVLDEEGEEIVLSDVETTYKLYVEKDGVFAEVAQEDISDYLTKAENNIYYFSQEAIGKTFRLDVTLSDKYELLDEDMNTTVSREFDAVEGYNVYNAQGLSVLDTLNVKAWADLKETQLAWDDKKLSEYTDIKWVIIHNDITVYPKDLPASYFWKTTDTAAVEGSKSYNDVVGMVPETLRDLLPGSLKEVNHGEEWEGNGDTQQRALYVSDGIGVSGNFLKLTYSIYNEGEENNSSANKIAIVHDMNMNTGNKKVYPESHTSFISFTHELVGVEGDSSIDKPRTIENVYFVGNNPKSEGTSIPAGLMMMTSDMAGVKLINDIGNRWFCNATLDGTGIGELTIDSCKFYDSFSQMVFSWGTTKIDIRNSEMKRAGGPILIMQTVTRGTRRRTVMTVDSDSVLESWVTGSEMWFTINMGGSVSVVPMLLQVATAVDGFGTHYNKGEEGNVMANLVAIVIPEPENVMTNQQAIPGEIKVGDYSYAMENSVFAAVTSLYDTATSGAALATQTIGALGAQAPASLTTLQQGFTQIATATALLRVAPFYQSGNAFAYFDGTTLKSLADNGLLAGVQQLCGGAAQVATVLEGVAAQYETAGDVQTATALKGLAAQWTDVAAKLQPIASLEAGDAEQWAQSWTEKNLAVWVNPGGLDAKSPNFNLKHFMILLGQDSEAEA